MPTDLTPLDLTDSRLARERAKILRALGNPARLRIVARLSGYGEQTVGAISDALSLPQSTVSRQLSWLRLNDLVVVRSDGNFRFYTIAMPRLRALLECLQSCGRDSTNNRGQES